MNYDDYMMSMQALQSLNNTLANSANVIVAANTSKQDRKFSREMSDLSWQRNIDAWNMQNEYNLPVNQFARQLEGLQANGLNPNLVYGNSSSVSGAAGSMSPYRFEGYHSTVVPQFRGIQPIQELLQTKLMQTQIATQEAQADLIKARADNESARTPGITAKSEEAAARWNYILNHLDDQESAWRAEQAMTYWKGQQSFSTAEILKNKASMTYYEAAMAEWLNTTEVPGTGYTYQQYMERYKAMIPAREFQKLKEETLNLSSMIAYRESQGEYLDLKKEYQRYVNEFAKYGRAIGNDWVSTLISGLMFLYKNINPDLGPVEWGPKGPVERGASEPGDW